MPTPAEFLVAAQGAAVGVLVFALITALAFAFKWGIRFRLVGATGFTAVLTVGLLGLSFEPFTPTVVAGAIPYTTVYDSGASQVVVAVPPTITADQIEPTLRQAAANLFKPYRLAGSGRVPTLRLRTTRHDDGGVSTLLYLGQVQPGADAGTLNVTVDAEALAALASTP